MQQGYAISDPAIENQLYEIELMRRFAVLELINDGLPDESTILRFRHLLERRQLTKRMLDTINTMLEERGALLKGGVIVDAKIIHAAPSTQDQARMRDPEMHRTKKGNRWYFGMEVDVGADVNITVSHPVSVTRAVASNSSQLPALLSEDEEVALATQPT
jgi:IS5 family transposase